MKKVLNYFLKGIVIGNSFAIISYFIIYVITGNEGLKVSLDNLSYEYNYIRMILCSSLNGIVINLFYEYYDKYFTKKANKIDNIKNNYYKNAIKLSLGFTTMITAVMTSLAFIELIYKEQMFESVYTVIMILSIVYIISLYLITESSKVAIEWVNKQLKNRN